MVFSEVGNIKNNVQMKDRCLDFLFKFKVNLCVKVTRNK